MNALLLLAALAAAAPDTTRYVVLNHGRPAGDMLVMREGENLVVRYFHVDRNRGPRLMASYRLSRDGFPLSGESRPLDPQWRPGALSDRYRLESGQARWGVDSAAERSAPADTGTFFRLRNAPLYDDVMLVRFLLTRPSRSARILPSGHIRLEQAGDPPLRLPAGRLRARHSLLHSGRGATPRAVWLDDRNELVASEQAWFITVRPGAEAALPALRAIEMRYRERVAAQLAARLMPPAGMVTAIVGGDVFDAEQGVMRPRQTIIVRDGRIESTGPAAEVSVPAGASTVDATGQTIVPGLYDMHAHAQFVSQTASAIWQLATGVTTLRDLAADLDVAVSQRDRAAAGTIVSPRMILGGFIEGPGAWAGPSEALARTEAEAREWVVRYAEAGYRQIKLYNLFHPDLVPTVAAEARARGLRLSGHIPRGLSVQAAVNLGFDEINHSAFLFSTFFQDSLYTPRMRAYSAVAAAVVPRFDVDGAPMTGLIEFLRSHRTVVDGTFSLFGARPAGVDSATADAFPRNYGRLAKRLYDAGVTLVPGTDSQSPWALNTELEFYEMAGIPAPFVLQMATIISARVMGEEREYGSIAPGKVADLVIVSGRPAERIADLRNVERVMRAGRLYDPAALLEAVGVERRARAQATNQ